ncbi:MAG: OmpW/AlkL family protein [Rubrivivax sp.]
MCPKTPLLVAAALAALAAGPAQAQLNAVKLGFTSYQPDSRTSGIQGIGVPAGADARVGSATTTVFIYERMLSSNLGAELVLGVPPRVKARATGSVAFLGDDVLSAKNVAPTVFLNYHFGTPSSTFRPYVGLGVNYTRFEGARSKLAPKVEMSDSTGLAIVGGVNYAFNKQWSVFASAAKVETKSNLVATGSTVLTTTIDFRPTVYTLGTAYKF